MTSNVNYQNDVLICGSKQSLQIPKFSMKVMEKKYLIGDKVEDQSMKMKLQNQKSHHKILYLSKKTRIDQIRAQEQEKVKALKIPKLFDNPFCVNQLVYENERATKFLESVNNFKNKKGKTFSNFSQFKLYDKGEDNFREHVKWVKDPNVNQKIAEKNKMIKLFISQNEGKIFGKRLSIKNKADFTLKKNVFNNKKNNDRVTTPSLNHTASNFDALNPQTISNKNPTHVQAGYYHELNNDYYMKNEEESDLQSLFFPIQSKIHSEKLKNNKTNDIIKKTNITLRNSLLFIRQLQNMKIRNKKMSSINRYSNNYDLDNFDGQESFASSQISLDKYMSEIKKNKSSSLSSIFKNQLVNEFNKNDMSPSEKIKKFRNSLEEEKVGLEEFEKVFHTELKDINKMAQKQMKIFEERLTNAKSFSLNKNILPNQPIPTLKQFPRSTVSIDLNANQLLSHCNIDHEYVNK